ncbi:MAG: hypothetical protein M3011_03480 [Actinomycetota bacterium]|nr:hypothetical protein [Actinomycetota bacterium]
MRRTWVLVALVTGLLAAACARDNPTYSINEPSFHSAGPGAQDEIQSVLDAQAGSIVSGDWSGLLALYIPTERSRCPVGAFADASEQSLGGLRVRAQGSTLTAKMSDLHLDGFRASVDFQFVLPTFGLATTAKTSHYLKLGDRWFIDEKAC